jgi:threonine/homoserine/homoserine lactone efflux protein
VTSASAPRLDGVKSLVAFLPVVFVLVLVPGANNLVVVRETIAAGPRGGRLATVGTSLGILLWAAAVALGLGVLLQANPRVWVALQLVGGAVLVGLGIQGLVRSRGSARLAMDRRRPGSGSFTPALLTSLLNPRAGVVAVSLLPQFVGPGQDPALTTVLLGVTWAGLAGVWNLVGVQLVDRSRSWFAGRRGRRTTEMVSGGFLVAIGLSSGWAVVS